MTNSNQSARRDATASASGAVGSDPAAAKHFADKNDFGIPAANAGRFPGVADEAKNQPAGDNLSDARAPGSETAENRDAGVGGHASGAGSSSGGDLDTDWVGVGSGGSGLAVGGPDAQRDGADMIDDSSDPFAAAAPRQRNINPARGAERDTGVVRPTDMELKGTTVNRDGGDASTTGSGQGAGSVTSADNGDDAEAGEINLGEAGGDDN